MKVLILTSVYQTGWGVGLVVRKQAEGLGANNFDVVIGTPDFEENTHSQFNIIKVGTDYEDIEILLKSAKYDVVIVNTPPYFEYIAKTNGDFVKVAYDHGEPFPFLFDNDERLIREKIHYMKYNHWIPQFNLHICISDFIKLCSGFPESYVIYNGANHINKIDKYSDEQFRKKYNLNGFIITSLLRIGKREGKYKGTDILKLTRQKLLKYRSHTDINFVVAGKLAQGGEEIKRELEQNGFTVFPDVTEEFKIELLRNSDVFLSPSLWEGFNLPLVEAQYLGTASTALSVCSHPEVCPFHFNTIEEIVNHVDTLARDNDYKNWCAQVCQNYVTSKFKWEYTVEKLITLVKNATEQKQKGKLTVLGKPAYSNQKIKQGEKQALERHLNRMGLDATVREHDGIFKIYYSFTENPLVSIIIPNKNHLNDLQCCISSITEKSTYNNYQITIIDNGSDDKKIFDFYDQLKKADKRINITSWNFPFNFSILINKGVRSSSGEYLIFLNNDTEVITEYWIEEMLHLCRRKDVGAVGAKLLYKDNTIQHAGIILGIRGLAGHSHRYYHVSSPGYLKRLSIIKNVSAVTGACMMTKRSVFYEVGGFDENLATAFNDVDLSLKIRNKGYLIIWTPFAILYHHERKTRGLDETPETKARFAIEYNYMRLKWGHILDKDPYYSPNLTLQKEDFSLNI